MERQIAFVLVVGIGFYLCGMLFRLYRREGESDTHTWLDRWRFTPGDLGGFSYRALILVSLLGLFLFSS